MCSTLRFVFVRAWVCICATHSYYYLQLLFCSQRKKKKHAKSLVRLKKGKRWHMVKPKKKKAKLANKAENYAYPSRRGEKKKKKKTYKRDTKGQKSCSAKDKQRRSPITPDTGWLLSSNKKKTTTDMDDFLFSPSFSLFSLLFPTMPPEWTERKKKQQQGQAQLENKVGPRET